MPVTIKGIRLDDVTIKREGDETKIETQYALISSADKVLANQSVGGYNGMKLQPSLDTLNALDAFIKAYKKDIETAIGIEAN